MKRFQRKIEDFVCENCGQKVAGDGFTNHCPKCLWSKHVDENPGDRASNCHSLMEPISVEFQSGEYYIIQKCQKCGIRKRIKSNKNDDFDSLLNLSKKPF